MVGKPISVPKVHGPSLDPKWHVMSMVVICVNPYASSFQMVIKLIDDAQGPPKNDIVGKNDDGI